MPDQPDDDTEDLDDLEDDELADRRQRLEERVAKAQARLQEISDKLAERKG
jgi:uncharacterized coiled-coil protein SlyX